MSRGGGELNLQAALPLAKQADVEQYWPGTVLDVLGARIRYAPGWLSEVDAAQAFVALQQEVPYSRHQVRLFGRVMFAPRYSAWIGDPGAHYSYSQTRHLPLPWTPTLLRLRTRLQQELGCAFNSVLVNRYRDGQDSMGWHADDERELGPEPVIASISLGALRRLRFRARSPATGRFDVELANGSLLLMSGTTQAHYQHAIDKTRKPIAERINLTFRQILPVAGSILPSA